MLKAGEEWVREGNVLFIKTSKISPMGNDLPKHQVNREPTEAELDSALSYLNEQTSFAITLYCRNEKCASKGSWIQRSKQDAAKNVYTCETCNHPLAR